MSKSKKIIIATSLFILPLALWAWAVFSDISGPIEIPEDLVYTERVSVDSVFSSGSTTF